MEVRDLKMIEGIEKHKYLRTDQAAELYFQAIKNRQQRISKARSRLLMLYKHKLLQRARFPNEPYIYFIHGSTRSHKMNHYLTITDVLLQILPLLPASSKINYDIEIKTGSQITDLLLTYSNEFRKEKRIYYIEVELDSSGDIESKIRAYENIIDEDKGQLIVVAKHQATLKRIQTTQYFIPVVTLDLAHIKEQWATKLGGMSFT